MKVVFFGTPPFAAEVLKDLLNQNIDVVAVVTKPDRPKGRSGEPLPTAVKAYIQENHPEIPLFQPAIASDLVFAETLASFEADLFVVVAYGEIIKQHLLEMPKLGCINLHASLLPKYRGAAPIQHSIINGDKETGVTVIHMVKKMDAGDMIKQAVIPIHDNDSFSIVEKALRLKGSEVLIEVIHSFAKGKVEGISQDDSQATYAAKIELEDCQLDFNRSAKELHDLIRAVTPEPGAWCYVSVKGRKKRLKVYSSLVVNGEFSQSPGNVLAYNKKEIVVVCRGGALSLVQLQLEGKRVMFAQEFVQGISDLQFSGH